MTGEVVECANLNCDKVFKKNSHNHKYCEDFCKRQVEKMQKRKEAIEHLDALIEYASLDEDEELDQDKADLLDEMGRDFLERENMRLARLLVKHKSEQDLLVRHVYTAAQETFGDFNKKPVPAPRRSKSKSKTELIPVLSLADWQTGKKTPTYNTPVLRARMELLFQKVMDQIETMRSSYDISHMRLWGLGDIVEGEDIFPSQQNLLDSSIFRQTGVDGPEIMRDCIIDPFLAEMDTIRFVGVIGNHGNLSGRFASKYNPESNMDRLLYQILSLIYNNEDRIEFEIPQGDGERNFYAVDNVGNYSCLLMHGDQFPKPTSFHGYYKKVMGWKDGAIPEPFEDVMVGHYHQTIRVQLGNSVFRMGGCFPAGTDVLTPDGAKKIEDVAAGDKVFSRDGSTQKVERLWEYESTGIVSLGIKGLPRELNVTPNHKIWAMKGQDKSCALKRHGASYMTEGELEADEPQWIPAGMLSAGDWVHSPIVENGDYKPFDVDVAWAIGLYLAEGHVYIPKPESSTYCRLQLDMHIDEADTHLARAKSIFDKFFDREGRISTRPDRNTSTLVYGRKMNEFGAEFRADYGHKAWNKMIPDWMHEMPAELKSAVVDGWLDGDGTMNKRTGVISGTTTSYQLAWGMYNLALSAGKEATIAQVKTKGQMTGLGPVKRDTYDVSFPVGQDVRWVNGERFLKVCHRRHSAGNIPVYDLQVTGEHTYVAGGVGVHNSPESYNTFAQEVLAVMGRPSQYLMFVDPVAGEVVCESAIYLDEV